MEVKIDFDFIPFQKGMEAAIHEQIPFAVARALTRTAKDCQGAIRDELPKTFVMRTPWLKRGIRITPATKAKLWSVVGSVDENLVGHVTGEVRSKPGTRSVPGKAIRPNFHNRVPRSKKPGALIRKGGQRKPFFTELQSGRKVLAQRTTKARLPLKVLYHFPSRITIKRVFKFEEIVNAVVAERWQANMIESLDQALKTRR